TISPRTALPSPNRHFSNTQRRSRGRSAKLQVRSDVFQILQHISQVSRDGYLRNRESQLAVPNPEARGAARIVAGYDIDPEAHQLGHVESVSYRFQNLFRRLVTLFQV